jgi:hypothetical protein
MGDCLGSKSSMLQSAILRLLVRGSSVTEVARRVRVATCPRVQRNQRTNFVSQLGSAWIRTRCLPLRVIASSASKRQPAALWTMMTRSDHHGFGPSRLALLRRSSKCTKVTGVLRILTRASSTELLKPWKTICTSSNASVLSVVLSVPASPS